MRRLAIVAVIVAAVVIAVLLFARGGGASRDVDVVIAPGSSLTAAAEVLERNDAIGSAAGFIRHAKLFGSKRPIRPGEYRVKTGMTDGDVFALLQSGRILQRFVTIPEGMPSILVYERLRATRLLSGDIDVPAEGSVLPDSYAYTRDEPRAAVLLRMQSAMRTTLADAWKARKVTTAVTSPEEAIVLASIIEKETARASERRLVSAVYNNRLKRGMPLQADPTVIYPVTKGKPLGRRILKSELQAVNGYNTYRKTGLPIGPIANPGKASIAAALDPETSNVLYFVAQEGGGSAFAETLGEHNANVARWYAHRRERGDM